MITVERKPISMMSYESAHQVCMAFKTRLADLIECWLKAQEAGNTDEEYGTGFWAGRIQRLIDAMIDIGMKD